jgi:signal transduction histidine kinase
VKRVAQGGLSFKLFWVGLAELLAVFAAIMATSAFVARRAARWDIPAILDRVEPVAARPAELGRQLLDMRAAGGPAVSIYDSARALVASNVVPPLAVPKFTFDPPRAGTRPSRPPPGLVDDLRRALGGPPLHVPGHLVALHLPLPSGMGTLVIAPAARLSGWWLLLLTVSASLLAVGLGAYLTARLIVQPLLRVEKELVANVAHELRTPLSRIRVALDIAGEGDAATARASLADIDIDLAELERLIDDVLTAARLELTGRGLPLNLETLPSSELLDESVARFRIRHPQHRLEVERDAVLPACEADPVLLRRTLDNVLENAAKYSPDTSHPIGLAVTHAGDRLCFEIRDHGIGVSKSDLRRVFSPFFRAERSRTRSGGGVGLGLTLAKQIVLAHGGTIRLESEPAAGTTVRIELPARSDVLVTPK